jgi:hypothetical protein
MAVLDRLAAQVARQAYDQLAPQLAERPTLERPRYRMGQAGRWTIRSLPDTPIRGYWSGHQVSDQNLILECDGQTWMSCTPMERESQALAVKHARGHVLVYGLGLGVIAWNLARKPEVTKVTVIERDPDVIRLIEDRLEWGPERGKIEIVLADGRRYRSPAPVDLLYADIWLYMDDDDALADTQRMHRLNPAPLVYYWTQELTATRHARDRGRFYPFKASDWWAFKKHAKLPLLGLDQEPGYVALVNAALTNTMAYNGMIKAARRAG